MWKRRVLLVVTALWGVFWGSAASVDPRLILVFSDDPAQMTVTTAEGKGLTVSEGMALSPGATIRTQDTTAEFRLSPNGSALKLGKNTTFRIGSLETLGAGTNSFSVFLGKVRLIAAKVAGVAQAYEIHTPNAQAGVRGTDFAVEANGDEGDWVCVKEGVVEFSRTKEGKIQDSILVSALQFANVKAAHFVPRPATSADLADKFEDLDFHRIAEKDVPGHQPSTR